MLAFETQRQIKRFFLAGGSAFVIDAGGYYLLTRFGHFPYLLARSISTSLAVSWNFTLNRQWTFMAVDGHMPKQALRFIITSLATAALNIVGLHIGVAWLHFPDMLVLITLAICLAFISFVIHKHWTYA